MYKKTIFVSILIVMCLFLFFSVSFSQDNKFPVRPIECVVPYSPGGQTDTLARAIAEYYDIGQPMVVVNMPGAGASLGTMEVYSAEPDGYKILIVSKEAQLLYYLSGMIPDPTWKEMIPLGIITFDSDIISVSKESPFDSFQDIIDYAKKNPGELTWGSAGTGSSNHIFSALIWDEFGIDVNYVPYKGNADARTALLGGHLDVSFGSISEAKSFVESGVIKPIIITSTQKNKFLPNVPVLGDLGKDINLGISTGLWLPPDTPKEVAIKLTEAFEELAHNQDFVDLVSNKLHYEIVWQDPESVIESMEEYFPKYKSMVEQVLAE